MSRASLVPGAAGSDAYSAVPTSPARGGHMQRGGDGGVKTPRVHVDEEQESVSMNVILWVVQAALALLYLSGGSYKLFSTDDLSNQMATLPPAVWQLLGVLELIGAVLLVVPAALKKKPLLTPLAAALLALETLALAAFYAVHSLELAATNPMVWALGMGLLAAFVAYGRYSRRPSA